jgi:Tfp pilus assembly PilM family ATPase/Tfp pilus assembly protein PilN
MKIMAGKKTGFSWGDVKFHLVETQDHAALRVITIPLISEGEAEIVADQVRLTAFIQKAIQDERIAIDHVKLSLPAGESIIRSFLLPLLKANEVGPAVEFEIRKYIPFSLKDLAYAYHATPVTENKVKKTRIAFVAVRRDFLDRCSRVLEQAGMTVVYSEPAPLSLMRALQVKKFIQADQKIAILQIESKAGRIFFAHEETILFIHEFNLNVEDGQEQDLQVIRTRLLNQIHNSLEFYNRQFSNQPITNMLVVTPASDIPYSEWVHEDLGFTVKIVDPMTIVPSQDAAGQMAVVNAFGVSMAEEGRAKVSFNLSRKTVKHSTSFSSNTIDYSEFMVTIKTAIICAVLLTAAYFLSEAGISQLKTKAESLRAEQSDFVTMTADDIQAKIKANNSRLQNYKDIEIKSDIVRIYAFLPTLLPEGVWLQSINVTKRSEGKNRELALIGYAFAEDPNQAIRAVNEFVSRVRKNKNLSKYFTNVTLSNMQRQLKDGKTTISFSLNCT